ncbi:MAG TPA: hypothetical protein VH989_11785 [Actinomycetota bacterium]|jgi:hypothetical protein
MNVYTIHFASGGTEQIGADAWRVEHEMLSFTHAGEVVYRVRIEDVVRLERTRDRTVA